jgi:hypothetical protein
MSSSSSTTQDRLRRKLAWTRPVWLAILGAIQRASTPITAIEERDAEDFSLNPYLKQLEDAEFYEIVYDHSSDRKDDHKIKDCMGEVNEHLRNGALTFRACQKGTYVFWDIGMDPILLPFPLDSTRDLEASIPCYIKPILR